MSLKLSYIAAAAMIILGTASATSSMAQEVSAEHLAAARKAIASTKATEAFDLILPQSSLSIKNKLANDNPDKSDKIDAIVDEEALKLAPRRGDLEAEAAKLFAANFTQEELSKLAEFFATETGQKYLSNTPVLARELSKAARVWAAGIQRDMAVNSAKRLQEESN